MEETKQTSEPDAAMTRILKLSDREFKITVINMLRAPNGKSRQHCKNKWVKKAETGRLEGRCPSPRTDKALVKQFP